MARENKVSKESFIFAQRNVVYINVTKLYNGVIKKISNLVTGKKNRRSYITVAKIKPDLNPL